MASETNRPFIKTPIGVVMLVNVVSISIFLWNQSEHSVFLYDILFSPVIKCLCGYLPLFQE